MRRSVFAAGLVVALLAAAPIAVPQGRATGSYAYRGTSSGSTELTTTGSGSWEARAVEASVRPLAGAAGSIGLVLHYQDASNHYLFLVSTNSTALMIYKNVGGVYTLLGSTPHLPLGEMLGNEYLLRGEDDGAGNLTILWDGVPKLTVFDETFSSGAIALRTWAMTADFDDVLVEDVEGTVLLFDDFEDGDADGWSASAAWSVVSTNPGGPPMPVPVVDTGFEGGNGEVVFVDPENWTVYFRPQLKGSSPYRAWFYFKMTNLSSAQPTNLVFQSVSFFTRPWYSYDQVDWSPLPGGGSNYTVTFSQEPVWIAHSIPYLTTHLEELIADVTGPSVQTSLLATSEGGRRVELLEITAPGGSAEKCGVWLVARNHAWEASGSWIADAFVRWLVSAEPKAMELLEGTRLFVVPILDVDNVAIGGSGKDQQPVDFNRDWRAEPHWTAVAEAIDAIDAFAAAAPYDIFIDSHCPGSGSTFLAVQPNEWTPPQYWSRFHRFRQRLASNTASYSGAYVQWGPAYHPLWYRMSFWHQFFSYPTLKLSLTLETAVGPHDSYRDLARGLGLTLWSLPRCRGSEL